MSTPGSTVLNQSRPKRVDIKLAAELRAQGCTWTKIAELTGACSPDAVRQQLNRKGVVTAIRTVITANGVQAAKQAQINQSQETRTNLSKAVLAQSEAITKIKAKPNLKSIKKFGDAIEPLVRSAERIHGWNSQSVRPLVNLNVLGSVQLDCGESASACGPEPQPVVDQVEPNTTPSSEPTPQDGK